MKIKKRKSLYKDGDYLMESDLTGRIMYRSDAVKMWNGMFCHRDEYEIRNPQDFIRAMPEHPAILDARVRKVTYITTPITADDL